MRPLGNQSDFSRTGPCLDILVSGSEATFQQWQAVAIACTLEAMGLHHVNFHTAHNVPVFEDSAYDAMLRIVPRELLHRHRIVCLRWELLPTHIHLLLQDFPDFPLPKIVQRIKGGTAYAYPQLREDLFGGHLWAKGYYHVHVATNDQFWATLNYIKTNREHAGLSSPGAMHHSEQE